MIPVKYGYLTAIIAGMGLWLWMFITRKDLRKMMLSFGFFFAILSALTQYFWWTRDWWHPLNITGTKVGIEDLLMGFGVTGVVMSAYAFFLKKKIVISEHVSYKKLFLRILVLPLFLFLMCLFVYFLHLPTFYSIYLTMIIVSAVMFISRKDLLIPGLVNGILTVVCMVPLYWITILLSPHWVQVTYDFNHLSGVLVTGIPIEELIFFFFWGIFLGTLYEFWFDAKFESI